MACLAASLAFTHWTPATPAPAPQLRQPKHLLTVPPGRRAELPSLGALGSTHPSQEQPLLPATATLGEDRPGGETSTNSGFVLPLRTLFISGQKKKHILLLHIYSTDTHMTLYTQRHTHDTDTQTLHRHTDTLDIDIHTHILHGDRHTHTHTHVLHRYTHTPHTQTHHVNTNVHFPHTHTILHRCARAHTHTHTPFFSFP